MPRVPVYERQFEKESVSLGAPTQSLNAPAEAFGAGDAKSIAAIGQGTASIGTAMMVVAKRMKSEEDEAKATQAYQKYLNASILHLHGDGTDENPGLMNLEGERALGATKLAREKLDAAIGEAATDLTPDQRQLFQTKAESTKLEKISGVSSHEAKQRKAYLASTLESSMKGEASSAVLNYHDPNQVNNALARGVESLDRLASIKGLSPESTQYARETFQSGVLKDVALRHITNGNFTTAQELLSDKRILGPDAETVEKSLKSGRDKAMSYGLFEEAMRQPDPLQAIRDKKNLDPTIREAAEGRVKAEIQWLRSEQKEQELQAARAAEDGLVRALDQKNVEEANRIVEDAPAGQRKELRTYMMARLEGRDIVDDPAEKWRWTQLLANDPEKFKQEWNSPAMLNLLSPATRANFDSAYVQLGKAGSKPVVDEFITDGQILANTANQLGFDPNRAKDKPEIAQKYGDLERQYSLLMQMETTAKGRKLTSIEKQEIVDREILYKGQVTKPGRFWGTTTEQTTKFEARRAKDQTFRPDAASDPVGAVQYEARAQGVDETLAAKVLRAESGGNAKAVSPKGAVGLMQLMPGTAKDLGVDPKDPNQNIRGGVKYLGQQLSKYKDQRLALMAYNWGPGNVDAWLQSGAEQSKVPPETIDYVRKILMGRS